MDGPESCALRAVDGPETIGLSFEGPWMVLRPVAPSFEGLRMAIWALNLENKRNLIYILVSGFQKETTSFDQNLNTAATT